MDQDKDFESYIEDKLIKNIKDTFGIEFEKPSQEYKNELLKMLDDTEVKSSDIKKYLHPIQIKKFLHMIKKDNEDKEPILNNIKLEIIMSNLLANNRRDNPDFTHEELYKKVIKDIENYK